MNVAHVEARQVVPSLEEPAEEEEERRLGTGPPAGRKGRPEPPRFLCWEPLRKENFQRNTIRAWNRPEFVPQPFIQVHNPCPTQFPTNMYGPFGYVHPNAPPILQINHLRPHLPCPWLSASPPPLPLDPEASSLSEESDDSEEGDSMEANPPSPKKQ